MDASKQEVDNMQNDISELQQAEFDLKRIQLHLQEHFQMEEERAGMTGF